MRRYTHLERLGLRLVGISETSDGDCARGNNAAHRALLRRAGVEAKALHIPRQVHGTAIWHVGEADVAAGMPCPQWQADAVLTNVQGLPVGVTVADCVPVFLYANDVRAGGVVHAGREGTFQNIAGAAVAALVAEYDAQPGNIHAIIGPSAGPCCYEVSVELADAFAARGLPKQGRHLDLWRANALQLNGAGVPPTQITLDAQCTICGGGFHSLRATGTAARNLAILVL